MNSWIETMTKSCARYQAVQAEPAVHLLILGFGPLVSDSKPILILPARSRGMSGSFILRPFRMIL